MYLKVYVQAIKNINVLHYTTNLFKFAKKKTRLKIEIIATWLECPCGRAGLQHPQDNQIHTCRLVGSADQH